MRLISREDLRQRLDGEGELKLVCALSEWAYRAVHIPGSIHVDDLEKAGDRLGKEDEIVVYCSNVNCFASIGLYNLLTQAGYENVRRYAGGLEDWEEAGYPLVRE